MTETQLREILYAWPIEFSEVETREVYDTPLTFVTAITGERYILKNVGEASDMSHRTERQHKVTQHLHRNNIPVAYLLTTRHGGFSASDGTDLYILMPALPREQPNLFGPNSAPIFDNLGRTYARLHDALAEFDKEVDTWSSLFFDRLYERTAPLLRKSLTGEDLRVVEDLLDTIEEPMRKLSPQLEEQVILWDCHTGNTIFSNGQVSGFVDCDHISNGPRVFDIANMASNMIVYDQHPDLIKVWLDRLPVYVRAYHQTSPLSDAEQQAIAYGIQSFSCVLFAHFLEYGGKPDSAAKTLNAIRWHQANHDLLHAAVAKGLD